MRLRFLRLPQSKVWLHPVAGGLRVGLTGLSVPQVLGVGYGVLNGPMAFKLMVLLVVLKLFAITTSYAH